ncbi:hypothetical protein [Paraburkholderia phenazinium]|uniref:Uncharacterized protein n=1 Tax=Paraburkholderia phenazinium TaxID=60549 RepID=A0A1N6KYG7_9BURK|nr:hypothetical protein [Paraburkholderia phenazinium]SIO61582.1 hypothetical protein SAMN05444165_5277 [Paraburkholderia phenazinium]
MFLPRFVVTHKSELLLGILFLAGVALGLAVLLVPHSTVVTILLTRALKLILGITTIVNYAVVALLCVASTLLPTRYRNSVLLSAGARVAAKRVARLSMRAVAALLGLNCVIAYSHDWHALAAVLSATVWFLALRRLTIENTTGIPHPRVAAACAGWLIGVSFQPTIGHFVALAMHVV